MEWKVEVSTKKQEETNTKMKLPMIVQWSCCNCFLFFLCTLIRILTVFIFVPLLCFFAPSHRMVSILFTTIPITTYNPRCRIVRWDCTVHWCTMGEETRSRAGYKFEPKYGIINHPVLVRVGDLCGRLHHRERISPPPASHVSDRRYWYYYEYY